MMWADRTAIGLSGITAVAIALTLVIDRLSYNPFLTTNETTVTTVRLKPGSEEPSMTTGSSITGRGESRLIV